MVDLANPLMGTDSSHGLSYGNTYPAVAVPWGMNFWTPVTGKMGDGWGYTYDAEKINGIKQTHQPSPWMNDYAVFSLFAETGRAQDRGRANARAGSATRPRKRGHTSTRSISPITT